MLLLAIRNLLRRPLRTGLTAAGLALSVAVLGCLTAFGEGYRQSLHGELDRMGMQMMLVPLGCPYDAAARVIKGRTLENSLPAESIDAARRDPAVSVAAPMLMAAVPRPEEGRTDMWAGIDPSALALKPWWRVTSGASWFARPDEVILGSEAAAVEMRQPGDKLYSPETGQSLRVAGVLARSGTSDDSLFFVPLPTAQKMFRQPGRLTAVAIRLKDPALVMDASTRLQTVRGAQVVTLTEMMGTFLNLVGAVRTLLFAIGLVAIAASCLGVFNTLLGSVLEQMGELSVMRALGASRAQVFALVTLQAVALALVGSMLGLVIVWVGGHLVEGGVKRFLPLAPPESLLRLSGPLIGQCVLAALGVGLVAGLYPAWQASRMQPAGALQRR